MANMNNVDWSVSSGSEEDLTSRSEASYYELDDDYDGTNAVYNETKRRVTVRARDFDMTRYRPEIGSILSEENIVRSIVKPRPFIRKFSPWKTLMLSPILHGVLKYTSPLDNKNLMLVNLDGYHGVKEMEKLIIPNFWKDRFFEDFHKMPKLYYNDPAHPVVETLQPFYACRKSTVVSVETLREYRYVFEIMELDMSDFWHIVERFDPSLTLHYKIRDDYHTDFKYLAKQFAVSTRIYEECILLDGFNDLRKIFKPTVLTMTYRCKPFDTHKIPDPRYAKLANQFELVRFTNPSESNGAFLAHLVNCIGGQIEAQQIRELLTEWNRMPKSQRLLKKHVYFCDYIGYWGDRSEAFDDMFNEFPGAWVKSEKCTVWTVFFGEKKLEFRYEGQQMTIRGM